MLRSKEQEEDRSDQLIFEPPFMLSRAQVSVQRLLGRLGPAAIFGVRLYLAIVVIQFVAGFVVGVTLAIFDYDLELLNALIVIGG